MATRVAAAAAIALATSYVIATQLRKKSKIKKLTNAFQGKIRLPNSVAPSRYDLEWTPNLDTCKFDGKMTVNVNIVNETKYIVLNAADLTITDKSVWLRSKTTRQVNDVRSHSSLSGAFWLPLSVFASNFRFSAGMFLYKGCLALDL